MSEHPRSKAIWTLLAGMGAGMVLAFLFAPKSGDKTREYSPDSAEEGRDAAPIKAQQWVRRVQKAAAHARKSATKVADRINEALPE